MTMKVFGFHETTEAGTVFHSVFKITAGDAKTARSTTICGKRTKTMKHTAAFDIGDARGSHHFTKGCDLCITGVTAAFDLFG